VAGRAEKCPCPCSLQGPGGSAQPTSDGPCSQPQSQARSSAPRTFPALLLPAVPHAAGAVRVHAVAATAAAAVATPTCTHPPLAAQIKGVLAQSRLQPSRDRVRCMHMQLCANAVAAHARTSAAPTAATTSAVASPTAATKVCKHSNRHSSMRLRPRHPGQAQAGSSKLQAPLFHAWVHCSRASVQACWRAEQAQCPASGVRALPRTPAITSLGRDEHCRARRMHACPWYVTAPWLQGHASWSRRMQRNSQGRLRIHASRRWAATPTHGRAPGRRCLAASSWRSCSSPTRRRHRLRRRRHRPAHAGSRDRAPCKPEPTAHKAPCLTPLMGGSPGPDSRRFVALLPRSKALLMTSPRRTVPEAGTTTGRGTSLAALVLAVLLLTCRACRLLPRSIADQPGACVERARRQTINTDCRIGTHRNPIGTRLPAVGSSQLRLATAAAIGGAPPICLRMEGEQPASQPAKAQLLYTEHLCTSMMDPICATAASSWPSRLTTR